MKDDEISKKMRAKWLTSENFMSRYIEIRTVVEGLFNDSKYSEQLKWFTIHGSEHSKALENTMYNLIPAPSESRNDIFNYYFNGCEFVKREQLTESERFFLIVSAWLHDLGMIKFSDKDKDLSDEQIRDNHHSRSEKYIVNNFSGLQITEGEASLLGIMAYYHRRRCPIEECPEKLTIAGHEGAIRVRLLAAYLRLADAMHVDFTRAPAKDYAILLTYNIPTSNKLHWLKSNFVLGISADIAAKTITVTFKSLTDNVMKECVKDLNDNVFEKEDRDERFKAWDNSHKKESIFNNTLDAIYDDIYQDLQGELDSVKEVLIRGNISCFLNVKKETCQVEIKDQFLNDIKTILHHYPSLNNPSGSSLYQIIVNTLIQICKVTRNESEEKRKDRIANFLNDVDENILKPRKSYVGLNNLCKELKEIGEEIPEKREEKLKRLIKTDIKKKYPDELVDEQSKVLNIKDIVDRCIDDISDKLVKELVGKQKGDYDDKKLKNFVDGLINEFIRKLKEELINKYITGFPYEQTKKLIDDLVKKFVDGHLKVFFNELIKHKFSEEQIKGLIDKLKKGFSDELIKKCIDEQINKLVEKRIEDIRKKYEICKIKPLTEMEIFLYHKRCKLEEDANGIRKNAFKYFSKRLGGNDDIINKRFGLFMKNKSEGGDDESQDNKVKEGADCSSKNQDDNRTDAEKQKEKFEKEFNRKRVDILLFGYSKLVIKTLCGFRDAVIKNIIDDLSKESSEKFAWHKVDLEKTASNFFRIFVCEGQPKNRLGWGTKVVYHDGTNYVKKLHEYGFTNIFLIPDATAASLMDVSHPLDIHFVIMGTNSYVRGEKFIHSAGHAMVAKLTHMLKEEIKGTQKVEPTLIFSVTTEKQGYFELNEKLPRVEYVEGWAFARFKDDEEIKKRFFFALSSKDRDTIKGFGSDFMIYNPKLDEIPYEYADLVIDENGYEICKPNSKPDSVNKVKDEGEDNKSSEPKGNRNKK